MVDRDPLRTLPSGCDSAGVSGSRIGSGRAAEAPFTCPYAATVGADVDSAHNGSVNSSGGQARSGASTSVVSSGRLGSWLGTPRNQTGTPLRRSRSALPPRNWSASQLTIFRCIEPS